MEDELERIRHKKMAEIMKRIEMQKKQEELKKTKEENTDQFLKIIMVPEAYKYYKEQIVPQRPHIANQIIEVIQYLFQAGILRSKLTREQLILIDRKLSGVGPSIRIKRPGKEYMDIATALKKED